MSENKELNNQELSEEELEEINGGKKIFGRYKAFGFAKNKHADKGETYHCVCCGKDFESWEELKLHWDYNMGCRPLANTCNHCHKTFATFQELRTHWDYNMSHRPNN